MIDCDLNTLPTRNLTVTTSLRFKHGIHFTALELCHLPSILVGEARDCQGLGASMALTLGLGNAFVRWSAVHHLIPFLHRI